MKFLGKPHLIIMWAILFAGAIWMEIELIKIYFAIQNKQEPFPCTYISGMCTIKPTYKNCLKFGHIPENVCEQRLNKRK
jgi:hypothetical protein